MAGSGRFPGWRIPTPMPGWQACRPPADPEEDHRARPIVLENHMEACYEGRRIVLIPECELRVLLPRMLCQREELRAQAAFVKTQLDQRGNLSKQNVDVTLTSRQRLPYLSKSARR